MPFDGTGFVSKPPKKMEMLAELSATLRDRSRWPLGFRWDYRSQSTCAIGLGRRVFGTRTFDKAARGLNIPFTPMFRIFIWGAGTGLMPMERVTPEHVADAIDRYVARRGAVAERIVEFT